MATDVFIHTVLVIEDNQSLNKMFCKHLSASGFTCHGVLTIDESITAINANRPDLLILDFELPDGYGTRVLDYMRSENFHIPVIVISGNTLVLQLKHTDYNISDILVKPVSPRLLTELVKQSLFF
ncbi:MAG: response regulator [bacterium]|nr:response regulator [bacterium]